jgi:hypothetical protein
MTRTRAMNNRLIDDQGNSVQDNSEDNTLEYVTHVDVDATTSKSEYSGDREQLLRENCILSKRIRDLEYITKLQLYKIEKLEQELQLSLASKLNQESQLSLSGNIEQVLQPSSAVKQADVMSRDLDSERPKYSEVTSNSSKSGLLDKASVVTRPTDRRPPNDNVPMTTMTDVNKCTDNEFTVVKSKRKQAHLKRPHSDNNREQSVRSKHITPRDRKRDVIVGTADCVETGSLSVAPKNAWLHLSRLNSSVTEEDVLAFLKNKLKEESFVCEKLSTLGSSNSFKVGAPFRLKDSLSDPSFWPKGVEVRRFFLSAKKTVQKT